MSGYIMELRKIVGHQILQQCAASIIIENEKGQILLGKRTDNHLWAYAGGSIELDEKAEDCARRELFEEMGLIAERLEFFMVNSGPEIHYVYPNGDEVSNIEIIYTCREYHGELKAQEEEMEELRFFDVADIDIEIISPPIRPVVQKYIDTHIDMHNDTHNDTHIDTYINTHVDTNIDTNNSTYGSACQLMQEPDHNGRYELIRAEEEWQRAGAYSVRIQGMNRKHHISLREEFDEHDTDGTRYIIILDDGYPVATCRFYEMNQESVVLGRVVVLPEYRGKQLGRRVVSGAELWIKELGYTEIIIDSRIEAVHFYEKLGYMHIDDRIIKSGNFDCVRMCKQLG